jgi:hypothetical protein
MNDYEAHQSSYDHQHKKRLKDMKEMQRQVQPKKEEKGPLMQIKLGGTTTTKSTGSGGGGFKKGGFKNAFGPVEEDEKVEIKKEDDKVVVDDKVVPADGDSDVTDTEDYYDPRRPTGCMPGCQSYVATGA